MTPKLKQLTNESNEQMKDSLKQCIAELTREINSLEQEKKDRVAALSDAIKLRKKRLKCAVTEYFNPSENLFAYSSVEDFFSEQGV